MITSGLDTAACGGGTQEAVQHHQFLGQPCRAIGGRAILGANNRAVLQHPLAALGTERVSARQAARGRRFGHGLAADRTREIRGQRVRWTTTTTASCCCGPRQLARWPVILGCRSENAVPPFGHDQLGGWTHTERQAAWDQGLQPKECAHVQLYLSPYRPLSRVQRLIFHKSSIVCWEKAI